MTAPRRLRAFDVVHHPTAGIYWVLLEAPGADGRALCLAHNTVNGWSVVRPEWGRRAVLNGNGLRLHYEGPDE